MRLESRPMQRGAMAGNSRKISYSMLLLLALGAALLSIVVLQKLRERRVLGILLQEQEQQLTTVQHLLQKEKEHSREMKSRLKNLKDKTISLSNQKIELNNKLMESETTVNNLNKMKKEMEAALEEKENQINRMTERAAASTILNLQVNGLTDLLKQKDDEINKMKHHLRIAQENPAEDNIVNKNSQNGSPEEPTSPSYGESSNKDVEANSENETAIKHEGPEEGKWVQFRTNLQDEESKESEGNNDQVTTNSSKYNKLKKLELSQENESSRKREVGQEYTTESKEETDLKDTEPVDTTGDRKTMRREWNSGNTEAKERHDHKDRESKKPNYSHMVYEQKLSSNPNFAEETDRTKMKIKHARRIKRRTKRQHIILKTEAPQDSENQMASGDVVSSTLEVHSKDASTNDNQPQTMGGGRSDNSDKEQTFLPMGGEIPN